MEEIPIDYTGRGPTGTGYRPTVGQLRRQGENRFRTDRVAEDMVNVDPYILAAVEKATRTAAKSNGNDPAKVRANGFTQATADVVMGLRRAGYVGEGDPVNYSHNVTRGITQGGFTVDTIGKDNDGRAVSGMNQRVSGQGLLSERVSKSFQRGLMKNLYGDSGADPAALSGFNMEEASGVASTIMRRGGVGKAATIVRNADIQTRIDAARDSAIGDLRDKLSNVQAGSEGELEDIIKATSDPRLKKTLEGVAGSTDAIVTNSAASKKLAGVVREVTKGMAALGDMYGELSSSELQAKLESISGRQIVSKSQAKAATNMVNDMRNNAESLGMDPRAYFDWAQQNQANTRGRLGQSLGIDERNGAVLNTASASLSAYVSGVATQGAVQSKDTANKAREQGIEGLEHTITTPDQVAKDMNDFHNKYAEENKGELQVRGALLKGGYTNAADKKKAEDLIKKKENAADDSERREYERQLKTHEGNVRGGGSFEASNATHAGAYYSASALEDSAQLDQIAKVAYDESISKHGVNNVARDNFKVKAEDSVAVNQALTRDLGAGGLVDLNAIAGKNAPEKDGNGKAITAADRMQQMRDSMTSIGMATDSQELILKNFIGEDGKWKDQDAVQPLIDAVGSTNYWDGGASTKYGKAQAERNKYNAIGSDSVRSKLAGEDGKTISFGSIGKAVAKGLVPGVAGAESAALTLEAIRGYGVDTMMVDELDAEGNKIYEKEKVTKKESIDLSGGFTKEVMDKIKASGGGRDLATKMGYGSEAELAEKTKGEAGKKARAKALDFVAQDAGFLDGGGYRDQVSNSLRVDAVDAKGNKIYTEKNSDKVKQFDLMKEQVTGIDLSNGFSKEAMDKLKGVNGGQDLKLWEKLGYGSAEELAEKTKGPGNEANFNKAYDMLRNMDGFEIGGEKGNISAITERAKNSGIKPLNDRVKAIAAKDLLFPGLSADEKNAYTTAAANGNDQAASDMLNRTYKADEADTNVDGEGVFGGGRQFVHLKNNRNMVDLAKRVTSADDAGFATIAEANADGGLANNIRAQIAALKVSKEASKIGGETEVLSGESGNGDPKNVAKIDESLQALTAALARLDKNAAEAKGGQTVGAMHVTTMIVDHIPDNKKK